MDAQDILKKYSAKLENQINTSDNSRDYTQFQQDKFYDASKYERWAKSLGNIISIKPSDKDRLRIERLLTEAHVQVSASQALSLAVVALLAGFFITILASAGIYVFTNTMPFLFAILGLFISLFLFA